MIDFNKVIESNKVLLRPMELNDWVEMKELTFDSTMWYYFTSDLSNETELKKWVEIAVSENKTKKSLPFTIIDPVKKKIIGTTRISNISQKDKRIEIGWTWISKEYQGTGINGHVKELLFTYCFEECDFIRIECKTDILNMPARKAMLKVGLTEEGVLRSHTLMTNNRRRDTVYYSILRDEWSNK